MEVNFFALKFTDFLKKLWHDLDLYQWPKIRTLTIHTTFMSSISPYFPSYILLIKVQDYWLDTTFWWWLTPKYIAFTRSYHKLEHWFICTSFRSQIPFLNQGQDCQYLWCGTDKQMWRPWLCRFENIYRAWQILFLTKFLVSDHINVLLPSSILYSKMSIITHFVINIKHALVSHLPPCWPAISW